MKIRKMDYLNKIDAEIFLKRYQQFLAFIGDKENLMSLKERKNVENSDFADNIITLRDRIFDKNKNKVSKYIDDFIENYKLELNEKEIEIINGWKKGFISEFFIISYLKEYSVFYDLKEEKPYGVLGIVDSIKNQIPVNIHIKTLLIPFGNKIISDGIYEGKNISFGNGFIRSFKNDFEKSKVKYGKIITNLNEIIKIKSKEEQELELLKYYLSSKSRLNEYWSEICNLWNKSEKHKIIYYLERGKLYSRIAKKRFNELGVSGVFVAVFEDTIISSSYSQKELDNILEKIVPKNKRDWIYIFKISKKRMCENERT